MFWIANFNEKGKFRMKCVGKYDASAECASWKILDLLIDHRNLLWNINFLKISLTFHEFPWLLTKFQISLTFLKREAVFTISNCMMVFLMTQTAHEPTTFCVRGGHANH